MPPVTLPVALPRDSALALDAHPRHSPTRHPRLDALDTVPRAPTVPRHTSPALDAPTHSALDACPRRPPWAWPIVRLPVRYSALGATLPLHPRRKDSMKPTLDTGHDSAGAPVSIGTLDTDGVVVGYIDHDGLAWESYRQRCAVLTEGRLLDFSMSRHAWRRTLGTFPLRLPVLAYIVARHSPRYPVNAWREASQAARWWRETQRMMRQAT